MYGRRASQLLREPDSCEAGQLAPFNPMKMVEQNLDIETTRNENHYGAAIHHLSLLRNKRCLVAYMYTN
ncbi:hypothetical protein GUJ93_ZPchr0005g15813 [Zizania palustris]|uniref:Uncharacterized protein n=1 Tax=Zizania palustris TaxID=103762 RepID=A0A8J5SGU5_ZIZPA|nr:hypothetical protein GUJ93_ZPchr0005g15813 [Zizania palustris]